MEIVMKNGIIITIDDNEIITWERSEKDNAYYFILRDGSRWAYYKEKELFLQLNS